VRAIVRNAAGQDYRLSAIVLGIVHSDAFQKERAADGERPGEQKVARRDYSALRASPLRGRPPGVIKD